MGKTDEYFGDGAAGLLYMEKMNSMLLEQGLQPLQHCFSLRVLYSHFIRLKLWTMEQIFVHI